MDRDDILKSTWSIVAGAVVFFTLSSWQLEFADPREVTLLAMPVVALLCAVQVAAAHPNRTFTFVAYMLAGLSLAAAILTGTNVLRSTDDAIIANNRRCAQIQHELLSQTALRADNVAMFQAFRCRPALDEMPKFDLSGETLTAKAAAPLAVPKASHASQ